MCIERFYIHITHREKGKGFSKYNFWVGTTKPFFGQHTNIHTVHIYLICLVFRIAETEKYFFMYAGRHWNEGVSSNTENLI